MGYQNVEVISGYSLFTATFKNINAENASFDLNTLVPKTPLGADITGDGKIFIYVLDKDGNYGNTIAWYGNSLKGWSADNGVSKIKDGEVVIGTGIGIAVSNSLKVDKNGIESTARGATASKAIFVVSGEVDLVCKNVARVGYSVNGNSTPVDIHLAKIIPTTPKGVTVSGNGRVFVYLLDKDGNYGDTITWFGSLGGWSVDNGVSKITATDEAYLLIPGRGFAISNSLKVDGSGAESTARGAVASPVVLNLPSPIETSIAE